MLQISFPKVLACSLNPFHQLSQSHRHRCHHFRGMYLLTQKHLVRSVSTQELLPYFCRISYRVNCTKWAQFIYTIWHNIWTSLSPFDLLKDIFIKGAVSTCFLDLFQAHDLLVEATLFSCSSVHVCSLNNKAATWLHAAPSLK